MWLSINHLLKKKKVCTRLKVALYVGLRKQPTFGNSTTSFPAKWRLRNERRNSILMTGHFPNLGSASDWSCRLANLFQPILYFFLCRSVGVKLSLLLAEQRHKRALEVIGVLYRSQFFSLKERTIVHVTYCCGLYNYLMWSAELNFWRHY